MASAEPAPTRCLVFARVRPAVDREEGDLTAVFPNEAESYVEVDEDAGEAVNRLLSHHNPGSRGGGGASGGGGAATETKGPKRYGFDGVFPSSSVQKDVFNQAGLPVLVDVMRGINGTIMAYGQTGSGKTFSLLNPGGAEPETAGLLPRLVATLFVRTMVDASNVYTVEAAASQVYNEQVDDLCHPDYKNGGGHNLSVATGGSVPGLTWTRCMAADELLALFQNARRTLVYAETRMNKASSRSHAVFQIRVTKRPRASAAQRGQTVRATVGQLSVVDLAGSERVKRSGVVGQQLKEAVNINGSLLALGNVVTALAKASTKKAGAKASHVPYRDSKLTRVLEGSVGGNCRTALLVCVSPAADSTDETVGALEFASRAMKVQCKAVVNEGTVQVDAAALLDDARAEAMGMQQLDPETIKRHKETEAALETARAKAKAREKEGADLRRSVDEWKSAATKAKSREAELKSREEARERELSKLREDVEETQLAAESLVKVKEAAEQKVVQVKEAAESEKSDLKRRLTAVEKELELALGKYDTDVKRLEKKASTSQGKCGKAEAELKAAESKSKQLASELKKLEADKAKEGGKLSNKLEDLTNELDEKTDEAAAFKEALRDVERSLKRKTEEHEAALQGKAEEQHALGGELEATRARADALEKQLDEAARKSQAAAIKAEEMDAELSCLELSLANMTRDRDASRAAQQEAERQRQAESGKRREVERARDEVAQKLEATEGELERAHEATAQATAAGDAEAETLREVRAALRALEERAMEETKRLQRKLDEGEQSLAEMSGHAESLETQLTQSRAESLSLAADLEAAEREAIAASQAHEDKVRALEAELGLTFVQGNMKAAATAAAAAATRREEGASHAKQAARMSAVFSAARSVAAARHLVLVDESEDLMRRFEARESRADDVATIARQKRELGAAASTVKALGQRVRELSTELDNRQANDKIFASGSEFRGRTKSAGALHPSANVWSGARAAAGRAGRGRRQQEEEAEAVEWLDGMDKFAPPQGPEQHQAELVYTQEPRREQEQERQPQRQPQQQHREGAGQGWADPVSPLADEEEAGMMPMREAVEQAPEVDEDGWAVEDQHPILHTTGFSGTSDRSPPQPHPAPPPRPPVTLHMGSTLRDRNGNKRPAPTSRHTSSRDANQSNQGTSPTGDDHDVQNEEPEPDPATHAAPDVSSFGVYVRSKSASRRPGSAGANGANGRRSRGGNRPPPPPGPGVVLSGRGADHEAAIAAYREVANRDREGEDEGACAGAGAGAGAGAEADEERDAVLQDRNMNVDRSPDGDGKSARARRRAEAHRERSERHDARVERRQQEQQRHAGAPAGQRPGTRQRPASAGIGFGRKGGKSGGSIQPTPSQPWNHNHHTKASGGPNKSSSDTNIFAQTRRAHADGAGPLF